MTGFSLNKRDRMLSRSWRSLFFLIRIQYKLDFSTQYVRPLPNIKFSLRQINILRSMMRILMIKVFSTAMRNSLSPVSLSNDKDGGAFSQFFSPPALNTMACSSPCCFLGRNQLCKSYINILKTFTIKNLIISWARFAFSWHSLLLFH